MEKNRNENIYFVKPNSWGKVVVSYRCADLNTNLRYWNFS